MLMMINYYINSNIRLQCLVWNELSFGENVASKSAPTKTTTINQIIIMFVVTIIISSIQSNSSGSSPFDPADS